MHVLEGYIYGSDFCFHPGQLILENGRIREIRPDGKKSQETRKDCLPERSRKGPYIIPGLVDIHFHGCMGEDVCDGIPEAFRKIAAWEVSRGVTAICPATLTLPAEELKQVLRQAAAFAQEQADASAQNQTSGGSPDNAKLPMADLIGINMEGPFISHVKKGAQNEKYIVPCSAELCGEFLEASGGLVKFIGLAPEENPDFEDYIAKVKGKVRVSLAHTNADYDTAMRAIRAGACHAVHLFNAMPELTHREPGVVGAAADSEGVTAELICDGNHVHPAVVRAAFSMLGAERVVLISDSLRAAGLGDGEIMLGGQKVLVNGSRAVLAEGGNLAGSVTDLMGCLQTAVRKMQIPLETAVRCATYNPARAIGEEDRYGSLLPGRKADIVVLDESLDVREVYKDGQRIPD